MSGGEAELTSFLLQTLKEVVTEYINVKAGAGQEFQKLNNELRLLEAFLKDSAKRSYKTEVFREMERQIRELVYDVEDTIETCLTKKAAAKTKNAISRALGKLSINMAQEIKNLRQTRVKPIVDEITKEFGKIEIGDGSSSENPPADVKKEQSTRQPYVTVYTQDPSMEQRSLQDQLNKHEKVVDFEDQATIIDYLMESTKQLDVISITGMPGLGKTTLARRIFHNPSVMDEFPLRIWIHVSQNFNSRDVFLDILKILIPNQTSSPSEEELIPTVCGCLVNKKFLLVMDDVWSVEDWSVIEKILPVNNKMGKVLVTSRETKVAAHASNNRPPHQLKPLGTDKSWELLKLNVFGSVQNCPQDLESIGEAIASNCGGSPLIIGVIAGILKEQIVEIPAIPALKIEWLKLSTNVSQIWITNKEKPISDAVELSYRRLPDDLRVCFLYTGLFPNNHEIAASTLTQLWIAEGFIRPKDGKSLEVTANKFLRDLIGMNLLMVEKMSLDQVKSCRVHDTIREFCKAKAMGENLFTLVKKSEEGKIEPSVSDQVQKFRRLCLHSDLSKFLSQPLHGPNVRSFLCFFKQSLDLDPIHISTIPDAFNMLRVLNCMSIKFGQFPKVTGLILLKHITLSIDNPGILPEQICQLLNLQTLIVETKSHTITVKANIWKMMQLRRFKTDAAIFLDDKKWKCSKAHENLQTLSRLSPTSCTADLSDRACNLKALGIRGKLDNLFNTLSLEKFRHLENLKLFNDLVHESASDYPLLGLPQSDRFPPYLKRLTLLNTYLHWDRHMPILARIDTLEVLKLKEDAFRGISWHAKGHGFQSLQFLLIDNSDLVIWEATTTYFPSLRWLVLKKCEKLQKIPGELAENLEKLEIERVKKSTADSARTIESSKKQTITFRVPFKLTIGPECDL